MTSHFLSLKRFLLLEDGEFAHSLATQLFHKVYCGAVTSEQTLLCVCVCVCVCVWGGANSTQLGWRLVHTGVSGQPNA